MDSLYKRNSIIDFVIVNFKWFVILAGILVVIMLYRGCGNSKQQEALNKLQAINDTLQVNVIASEREVRSLEFDKARLTNELETSKKLFNTTLASLNKIKDINTRLSSNVIWAKIIRDTINYIVSCDSLAQLNEAYRNEVEAFANYATMLQTTCDSTSRINDGIIKELYARITLLDKSLELTTSVFPFLKRRTELYGGVIMYGNESKPFYGFTGNVGLLTKKGGMFIVGYGILNKDKYYTAGYLGRLSLRKH